MPTTFAEPTQRRSVLPPVHGVDAPPVDPTKSIGVRSMNAVLYRISGEKVNAATASLPEEQCNALRWLHAYAAENNLPLEQIAARLKKPNGHTYSKDSVYQALTGKRIEAGFSVEPLCEAIVRFKDTVSAERLNGDEKLLRARAEILRPPFIETSLTKRIGKYCDGALTFQRIGFIYGNSQSGKTTGLTHYAGTDERGVAFASSDRPQGRCVYVRMPTYGYYSEFLRWIAEAQRISPNLKSWQIKRKIIRSFNPGMLFIVDQAHECFRARQAALASLIFVMEIFDRTGAAALISGTTDLEDGMNDNRYRDTMIQLTKRGFPKPLRVPSKPTAKNLNEFAAFYGLPPAQGEALALQGEVIRDLDLGIWLSYLQCASRLAHKKSQPMAWRHVLGAHDVFNALSSVDVN